MEKILCSHCGTELIEDDCLEQDIFSEEKKAYQSKIWHCPNCNIEYCGQIQYSLSIERIIIEEEN